MKLKGYVHRSVTGLIASLNCNQTDDTLLNIPFFYTQLILAPVCFLLFTGRQCRHCTGSQLFAVYVQQGICGPWNATGKGLFHSPVYLAPIFADLVLCFWNVVKNYISIK